MQGTEEVKLELKCKHLVTELGGKEERGRQGPDQEDPYVPHPRDWLYSTGTGEPLSNSKQVSDRLKSGYVSSTGAGLWSLFPDVFQVPRRVSGI